ncbi:MAG: MATE family efflux transporter [Clostridia bacterium]|nr:MATE family efflux transporter [Clostridia bacterium]MBO4884255.1 MATE family efflux transporter [Clostridia bacterium]
MERFRKMFGAQDMTVGKPLTNLTMFAVPLLIGNMAQQLYNTVDAIVVGKYVGKSALAAVGTAGPILNLLLLLFMGISTGAGILVAQYFGAQRREDLTSAVGTCLTLTAIASLFIMIVGPLITRPLMTLLGTPDDVYDMAVAYLNIICIGIIGTGYYNIVSGVLRGMGDSVTPLIFLVVACVLNIFLDILFVTQFHMTADGVALATVLAQGISAVLCLWRLTHMGDTLKITRASLVPDRTMTRETIRLGLPSGLTQAIFSMAAIVVQSLTNSFGTSVIACSVVVMRVDGFAMMPNFTFGMAMTTFVGQNVGAKRLDRVHEGVREGIRLGLIISVVLTAAILLLGRNLMELFTREDEKDVVELGVHMLRILAVGYIAMAVTQSLSGVMRGAGDTMTPMWVSVITTVIIRVPIAYGIAYFTRSEALPHGTPDSLYISLLISWIMGALITTALYRRGKWKDKAVIVK